MAGDMMSDVEMKKKHEAEEERYKTEDDVRSLEKAEEIKKDKTRYDKACAMMKEKIEGMMKVMASNQIMGKPMREKE